MVKKYDHKILELRNWIIELPDDAVIVGVTSDEVVDGNCEDYLHYLVPIEEDDDSSI